MTQTVLSLTPLGMARIHDGIYGAADFPAVILAGFRTTYECLGIDYDHVSAEHPVEPMDYAIPEDQWGDICQWLCDVGGRMHPDFLTAATIGLEWCNRGPSFHRLNQECTHAG